MINNSEYINFFIKVMVDNNKKPSKIFTYLSNSLGEDLKIGERRIYYIAKEFRDQNRISIERKEGSG